VTLEDILSLAVTRGITFRLEGNELAYRAPKGAMNDELRSALTSRKEELRALLERARASEPPDAIPRGTAPDAEPALLSPGQERLWLIDRMIGESPLYNVHVRLKWTGPVDRAALDRSLANIVLRQASLRTIFCEVAQEPRAVLASSATPLVAYFDLRDYAPEVRQQALQRIARKHRNASFDLARGPLTRVALLALADEDHVLLLTQHHIITDAWSIGLLLSQLAENYRALLRGRPLPLVRGLQYADYARHAGGRRERHGHRDALAWWQKQLVDLPRLELPYVRSTGPNAFAGDAYSFSLPPSLVSSLKDLARARRCTLYVVLLTGWAVLLRRYSGQADFAIGTVSSGRERQELHDVIGFFVNTLVLRLDLAGDPTVTDAIDRVRGGFEAALAHEVPFSDVVDTVGAERGGTLNPLIQAAIVFENARASDTDQQENGWSLTFEKLNAGVEGTAKFDLNLILKEEGRALAACLEYATTLFRPELIERMIGHLVALLADMSARPDARLSELAILSASERRKLFAEWNGGVVPFEERCIHELFAEQAARTPTAPALAASGEVLTYRQLDERANRLANHLRKLGVGADTAVGLVLAERSPGLIVGMLGILKAGGAYVPFDSKQPPQRLAGMLSATNISVVVSESSLDPILIPLAITTVRLDADSSTLAAESPLPPVSNARPSNLAYVLFTSGSTGAPKGVAVEHRQLSNYVYAISKRMGLPVGRNYAHVSTFAADLGHTTLFPSLCFGGCLHLIDRQLVTDAAGLGAYFVDHGIDCLKIVPSHLAALLSGDDPRRVLPRELLVLGGEASSWELIGRIRSLAPSLRILNHYGPTETTVGVLTSDIAAESAEVSTTVPLGRPLPNTRVYVLDAAMQPVPIGTRGELYIAGAQVARGYLGRSDLERERFLPDPFEPRLGARVYRTGDMVRCLESGEIEFLGRTDHQLKVRGFRVELGEIEAVLSRHPAVRACAVVPRTMAAAEVRLAAYVVVGDAAVTLDQLRQHLGDRLPDYMVPSWLVQVDAMPIGPNGKLDRTKLPEPEAAMNRPATPPRTPTEGLIAGVWQAVLGVEAVGVDQSFFALGGHSLLMIKVHARLKALLPGTPALPVLFERPTIEALARQIDAGAPVVNSLPGVAEPAGPVLVELRRGAADRSPLFLVHQAGGLELSYYALASQLAYEQPVYAVRAARGSLDGCVERLAARYIELLRARWPRGPYLLGGASFGGLVAYEMAQQLRHQAEVVGALLLLDTDEPAHMAATVQSDEEILGFLRRSAPQLIDELLAPPAATRGQQRGLAPEGQAFLGNFRECAALRAKYRPKEYAGNVVLFRAADRAASGSVAPEKGWMPLVKGQLQVIDTPGNHLEMLQRPQVDILAAHVARMLAVATTTSPEQFE
jgi:amino acid adenylation domain-containing protein